MNLGGFVIHIDIPTVSSILRNHSWSINSMFLSFYFIKLILNIYFLIVKILINVFKQIFSCSLTYTLTPMACLNIIYIPELLPVQKLQRENVTFKKTALRN